jgi:hypothetical protein
MLVFAIIIGSISLSFVLPVVRALREAGITNKISGLFSGIFSGSVNSVGGSIQEIFGEISEMFAGDKHLTRLTVAMFIVVVVVYKILIGFYELPVYSVLEGAMSSGVKLGFITRFVSNLGRSGTYVFVKNISTTVYDAVFFTGIYFITRLFFIPDGVAAGISVLSVYVVLLLAFRYTFIAFWGMEVAVNRAPVFASLKMSFKKSAKNFGSVFLSFLGIWAIILVINLFIGIFTFGIGLIATVPVSMLLVCVLNAALYYEKTARRYYVGGEIITPIGRKSRD